VDSEHPEREPRPVTFLAAAGWTIALKLLFATSLGVLEAVHPGAITDIVTITAARLLAVSVILFGMLRVHEPEASVRRVVSLRQPAILSLLLALVIGGALAIPASWIGSFVAAHVPKDPQETELLEKLFAADTQAKRAVLFAAVVVILPSCDELFFRGALFTSLKRGRRAEVVVLATAAYDALLNLESLNPRGMLVPLALLVAVGWIRAVTGSVVPAIAARVAFFAVLVGPDTFGRPDVPTTRPWLIGAAVAAVISFVALGAWCRRDARAIAARAEDA
jgi:membrane protease YdiL (CAAX protease family)